MTGLFFAWVFSLSGEPSASRYVRVEVLPVDVYSTLGSRSSSIWIVTEDRDFRVQSMFWTQTPYGMEDFEALIRPGEPLTLWVADTNSTVYSVRGIESPRYRFGPEFGVAMERENQAWGVLIVVGFVAVGAVMAWWGWGLNPSAV